MVESRETVFIVDDDASVLKSLGRLLRAAGYQTALFTSPKEFLKAHDAAIPGCVVCDVAMPALSGLDLQSALLAAGGARPIVFLTGRGNIPASVRAMKAGAVDFLTKPVRSEQLLGAIEVALAADRAARAEAQSLREGRTLLET